MGSFITRAFLAKYGHEIDGAIIMSTGQLPLYQSRAAILIGHLVRFFKGGDYASPLLHYFSTGRLNHAYAPNKTDGDWLSRDEAAVARSLGDSKRQFVPSVNMSLGIFHLANLVAQQATIDQIPRSLPLLLIAGDGDPLGNFGKGIRQLEERIARHHEGTLQTILYPGARHELLVETNKAEVMNDLLNWLNVTIQAENPTIQATL